MAESEEVSQRRREKVLSRSTSADSDEEGVASAETGNVLERYKHLKQRETDQRRLTIASRFAGLVILPLTLLLAPWEAYVAVAVLLVVRAFQVTQERAEEKEGKELSWIFAKVPLLSKLKHLDRLFLVLKVALYSLLSYLMAAVLLNAVAHGWQPETPSEL